MYQYKVKNCLSVLLFVFLLTLSLKLLAQTAIIQQIVDSDVNSAGFSFVRNAASAEPVIHYQQNIEMLSATNDMPSIKVYGNGHVLVHYPVYMKKAGDYEMQLDDAELVNFIHSLSNNGIMDFDDQKVKEKKNASKKALKAKGQLYAISDAVEDNIEIKLDEYQKNGLSKKIINFHKQFKWKNIEHDAIRYKQLSEITKANQSILHLKALMNDTRLVKKSN